MLYDIRQSVPFALVANACLGVTLMLRSGLHLLFYTFPMYRDHALAYKLPLVAIPRLANAFHNPGFSN